MKLKYDKKPSTYDLEALREEWREQAYRIAATEYAQIEADEIIADIEADEESGNTQELDAHIAQAESQTLRVIRHAIMRGKVSKFAKQTLPRVGQAAAAVIAIIAVSLTVAIAASHTLRVRVMELLINIEDQYTELSLQEDSTESFEIPADWAGSYYPAKIPSGFVVTGLSTGVQSFSVNWRVIDEREASIYFSENGEDSFTNLDTEESTISTKMITGSPALVAKKRDKISLAWSRDSVYFMLICEGLEEEEVIEIASSVVRVKN